MNAVRIAVIGNSIARIVFIICITYAAIHFQKPSLLWWYLVPAAMGLSVSSGNDKGDEQL